MPMIRKLIGVGKTSRAVILPKSWLQFIEHKEGQSINHVTIEVNKVLVIAPLLEKKLRQRNAGNDECV